MARMFVITSSFPKHRGDSSTGAFIYELFRRMPGFDHEVYVLAPHSYGLAKSDVMDNIRIYRFSYSYPAYLQKLAYGHSMVENIKESRLTIFQIPAYTILGTLRALQLIKRQHADIIVPCWTIPQGLMGIVLRKITKRPVVLNTFPVELSLAISKHRYLIPLLRRIFTKTDLILANSEFTKKLIMSYGVPPEKVHVIYPGVNPNRYLNRQDDSAKQRLGLNGSLVILTVARLVRRKGIKYLIEAMPRVLRSLPDTVLLVVGDGPEKPRLEEEARILGLASRVSFLGKVPEQKLIAFYQASDVFVLPAIVDSEMNTEGLGVVLLEAMSMGKPVVASGVGGIPEAVVNGETGLLVKPQDPNDLADAIIRLLGNSELSRKMGDNGRQRVKEVFDWDIVAASFSEVLVSHNLVNTVQEARK
jgi:glycosyltransferase involved in cell wall biosynthesis